MSATTLADVLRIYRGSDGVATTGLYVELEALGPVGHVAVNLFRAQKASERAKAYRGRGYRDAAYNRKQWAMDNLCNALAEHGPGLGIAWGWGEDTTQQVHRHVLYVELPTGQVSFHTAARCYGPDHARPWDGVAGASADRILRWIGRVLAAGQAQP